MTKFVSEALTDRTITRSIALMVTTDYLRTLVDFHYWARDRMLEDVERLSAEQYSRALGNSFSSVRDTVNHLYLGEWIWLNRWNGVSLPMPPTQEQPQTIGELKSAWVAHEVKMRAFVNSLGGDGPMRVVEYKTLAGDSFSNPIWPMLVHVLNHATYHRGQVTTMLRQLDLHQLKATDLILYFRTH